MCLPVHHLEGQAVAVRGSRRQAHTSGDYPVLPCMPLQPAAAHLNDADILHHILRDAHGAMQFVNARSTVVQGQL